MAFLAVGLSVGLAPAQPSYRLTLSAPVAPTRGTSEVTAIVSDGSAVYAAGQIVRHSADVPGALAAGTTVFFAKLSGDGHLLFWRELGAGAAFGIALGPDGDLFLAGGTSSPGYPHNRHFVRNPVGEILGRNAFVTKLSAEDGSILYSALLGGRGASTAYAVAVDEQGQAFVTGATGSDQFPTTPGALREVGGRGVSDGADALFRSSARKATA